ncbi:hypothetical protein FOMPIDRAFT_1055180 [Fomitopsis schrenkii]|uniref:Uncharacterized protein n=1 Tax=Fomitopsis schrenkii TaxID=2126942 RepID=S8DSU9_FOMSC|nr:hypothetical protein FOMPIDRAFT_1055180 [Fomitopsis schrenkii]
MRTSKEHVDAPWRCRKSLSSDADYAERKLSKMGPDNKNLQAQMDHTNNLRRDPILGMDIISAEEVNLGDYKRPTAKMWLAIMTDSGMLRQGNSASTARNAARPYGCDASMSQVIDACHALSTVGFATEPNLGGPIFFVRTYEGSIVISLPPHNGFIVSGFYMGDVIRRTSVAVPVLAGATFFADSVSLNGQSRARPSPGATAATALEPVYGAKLAIALLPRGLVTILHSHRRPIPSFGITTQDPYSVRASSMRWPEEWERLIDPCSLRFSTVSTFRSSALRRLTRLASLCSGPSAAARRAAPAGRPSTARTFGDTFEAAGAQRDDGGPPVLHSLPPAVTSSAAGRGGWAIGSASECDQIETTLRRKLHVATCNCSAMPRMPRPRTVQIGQRELQNGHRFSNLAHIQTKVVGGATWFSRGALKQWKCGAMDTRAQGKRGLDAEVHASWMSVHVQGGTYRSSRGMGVANRAREWERSDETRTMEPRKLLTAPLQQVDVLLAAALLC